MKRLMILALVPIGVLTLVLTLSGQSDAATVDTAAASVDPAIALVDQPVTFTSTNPCTIACSLTWRRPDIGLARFGGVIIGRGDQFTLSFAAPGVYQVVLDMGEICDGTTQLVCHSFAMVIVDVVTELPAVAPPPPDVVLPPDPVLPPPDVVLPPDPVLPPDATELPDATESPDLTALSLVAPSDLSATTVGRRNRLTWTNPESSATSLILERCEGTGCTDFRPIAILDTDTTSFIESRIRRGSTDISYRLAASDETGTVYSNIEVATMHR